MIAIVKNLLPKKCNTLNDDIARMSAYITKTYPADQRVLLLEGIKTNMAKDLEREKIIAVEFHNITVDAIAKMKAV